MAHQFVRPTWTEFAQVNLFYPLLLQSGLVILLWGLSYVYVWAYKAKRFKRFITKYIGKVENPSVEYPTFLVVLSLLQFVTSLASVTFYVLSVYVQKEETVSDVKFVFACFWTFHYFIQRLQSSMRPISAWSFGALVDVFTIVPILTQADVELGKGGKEYSIWLTFNYLRIYKALRSYEVIDHIASLLTIPELGLFLCGFIMRTGTVVVVMGGTIWTLEVLGELPGWADEGIPTAMDESKRISMIQMSYWMVTTVSTVGYGDFAPQTFPSRVAVTFFIFLGSIFFGAQITRLAQLRVATAAGMDRYIGQGDHLVLAGPGASEMSSMMQTLLYEILDPEIGVSIPDVVFLSEGEYDLDLVTFIRGTLPPHVQPHIRLLRGSMMSGKDQHRAGVAQCRFLFILPGTHKGTAKKEDCDNIMRALEAQRLFPGVRLRLMLLEEDSLAQAVGLGIARQRCFSVRGLTASVMAHSLRVRGLLTLVCGLLQRTTATELTEAFGTDALEEGNWQAQYARGTGRQIYGLLVGLALVGLEFRVAAAKVYAASGGEVLLVAAQVEGRLQLNWRGELAECQVVVCIATSQEKVTQHADLRRDWKAVFREQLARDITNLALSGETALVSTADLETRQLLTPTKRSTLYSVESDSEEASESSQASSSAKVDDLDKLEEHLEADGLMVVIAMAESMACWVQVRTLLERSRDKYLPRWRPIVVLAGGEPPEALAREFSPKRVAFVAGDPLKIHTLRLCGIERAESVAVVRGGGDTFGSSMGLADHEVVALSALMDTCGAASPRGRFTMYELGSTSGARLMNAWRPVREEADLKREIKSRMFDAVKEQDEWMRWQHWMDGGDNSVLGRLLGRMQVLRWLWQEVRKGPEHLRRRRRCAERDCQLLLIPRFAAGEIFTPDCFGGMLGHIYNFPGTIEFVEALCNPTSVGQSSFPWQVPCPAAWVISPTAKCHTD